MFLVIITVSNLVIIRCGDLDKEKTNIILQILLPTLAAVLVLVFSIPLLFNNPIISKLPSSKSEALIVSYLTTFILTIVISLFLLIEILPSTPALYKLCILLFFDCLIFLILYSIFFFPRSVDIIVQSIKKSIMKKISPPIHKRVYHNMSSFMRQILSRVWEFSSDDGWENHYAKIIKTEIDALRQILFQMLRYHLFDGFDDKIEIFQDIGKATVDSTIFEDVYINLILKKVIESLCQLGVECSTLEYNEGLLSVTECIKNLIVHGLSNQRNNLEYSSFITSLTILGKRIRPQSYDMVWEGIIQCLGNAAIISQEDLKHPCALECLTGMREIGVETARNRKENLSLMTINRVREIGRQAQKRNNEAKKEKEILKDQKAIVESEIERAIEINEKILKYALGQFWILCALMNKYIPESAQRICQLQEEASNEFGSLFLRMRHQTEQDLEQESFILKMIVLDYAKSC